MTVSPTATCGHSSVFRQSALNLNQPNASKHAGTPRLRSYWKRLPKKCEERWRRSGSTAVLAEVAAE